MKTKLSINGHVRPSNKKYVENTKKTDAHTEKRVKPVAKDTNKTRRKVVKPTKGQICD